MPSLFASHFTRARHHDIFTETPEGAIRAKLCERTKAADSTGLRSTMRRGGVNRLQVADVSWFVVRFATDFQYLSAADIDARAGPPCRSSYECVSATDVPLRCSMLLDPRCHVAPLATSTLEITANACVPEERAQRFWRINTSCLAESMH